jgi:hypothetical protein
MKDKAKRKIEFKTLTTCSQYGPEIQTMGLSSPYIFALPYLFMSLVNLVANILMESRRTSIVGG